MVKLTDCLERECAECCSNLIVLTDEEIKSGDYQMKRAIAPKQKKQFWVLKQGLDLKCVYLDRETSRCSIYENRPESCREWTCDEDEAFEL